MNQRQLTGAIGLLPDRRQRPTYRTLVHELRRRDILIEVRRVSAETRPICAGGLVDAHCPRWRSGQGAASFALTRWHSWLSPCRTPAGPQARAHGVRRRRAAQGCRLCWARCASPVRPAGAEELTSYPRSLRQPRGLPASIDKARRGTGNRIAIATSGVAVAAFVASMFAQRRLMSGGGVGSGGACWPDPQTEANFPRATRPYPLCSKGAAR